MITRRSLVAAVPASLAGLAACASKQERGFRGYAFVANEEGQAVAAIDLMSLAVARHIRLDGNPTAIVAPQGRGSVYALTPSTGCVHEIEADRLSFSRKVAVAKTALSMRMSPDGSALWILCQEPHRLVRLPLDTFRPDSPIALPAGAADFDLSREKGLAAVSLGQSGSFVFVDLAKRECSAPMAIGGEAGAVRFRSDSRVLIAANRSERLLSFWEAGSRRRMVELPLAVRPDNFCFNADFGQLFITGEGMDAVVTVYPYHTPEVAGTMLAGRAPGPMAVSARPGYLFVTNPGSGEITIVNIDTQHVIAVMPVGAEPSYIAVTPDSQYALVLNRKSGDMGVILIGLITASGRRAIQKSAAPLTMIPVGSKPVSAAIRYL